MNKIMKFYKIEHVSYKALSKSPVWSALIELEQVIQLILLN